MISKNINKVINCINCRNKKQNIKKNRNSAFTVNIQNQSHTRSTLLNEFQVVENSAARVHIHLHVLKVAVQHRDQAVKYPVLEKNNNTHNHQASLNSHELIVEALQNVQIKSRETHTFPLMMVSILISVNSSPSLASLSTPF